MDGVVVPAAYVPAARVHVGTLKLPVPVVIANVTVPVGVTMPEIAGSVTVAVHVLVVLTGTEEGTQETLVLVEWVAPLLKLELPRTTGTFEDAVPSISPNEDPETPGALATFVMGVEPIPTMNSTMVEVTFDSGGLGVPAGPFVMSPGQVPILLVSV